MKRINYKTPPKLRVHKYVVQTIRVTSKSTDKYYMYCRDMSEVRAHLRIALPGDIIEVYYAKHELKEAWEK